MSNLYNPNEPSENQDKKSKMDKFFEEMQRKIEQQEAEIEAMKQKLEDRTSPKKQPAQQERNPFEDKSDFSNDFDLVEEAKTENTKTASDFLNNLKEELNPYMDKAKKILGGVEEKAKDAFSKFDKYTDKLHDKLKKEDEAYQKKKASRPKFHTTGDSLFKGTEGLFDKARKFMDKVENPLSNEVKIIKTSTKRKKTEGEDKVYGFDDLDGDGNPIIDDAIIED